MNQINNMIMRKKNIFTRQLLRHFFRPPLHRDLPEGRPEDYHTWSAATRGADDGDNKDNALMVINMTMKLLKIHQSPFSLLNL